MSILSGLGNLGGIGKLLDPGALVKDVVNGVLPKNMGVVGDLAGAFVDFQMGNPIGAVQHAMEAVHDLPQAAKGLQQGAAANGTNLNQLPPGLEPPPPPLGSRAGKPFDLNELMSAIKALTAALTGQQTGGLLNTVPKELREKMAAGSTAAAGSTPAAETSTPGSSANTTGTPAAATTSTPATTTTASTDEHGPGASTVSGDRYRRGSATLDQGDQLNAPTYRHSAWVGEPRTPAPAPATHTSSTAAASTSSAAAPRPVAEPPAPSSAQEAASEGSAAASAPVAGASTGQTITSISQLQGMSDRAVRDAVMNGRIAPEVAKDQTAMMAIQQRMNAISEMNNLMTAMMRAVHDMQMAIIQNIRI